MAEDVWSEGSSPMWQGLPSPSTRLSEPGRDAPAGWTICTPGWGLQLKERCGRMAERGLSPITTTNTGSRAGPG